MINTLEEIYEMYEIVKEKVKKYQARRYFQDSIFASSHEENLRAFKWRS